LLEIIFAIVALAGISHAAGTGFDRRLDWISPGFPIAWALWSLLTVAKNVSEIISDMIWNGFKVLERGRWEAVFLHRFARVLVQQPNYDLFLFVREIKQQFSGHEMLLTWIFDQTRGRI
jgi:hypothetical protein